MRISDWSSDVCSSDLMPRRVGDDELALVGREEAIGDVDRDPLLALGGQPVDQQREIDLLPLRADPPAVRLQRRKLILEEDRKSVVSGKRVSVSVYLGGARLIKNTKTNHYILTY